MKKWIKAHPKILIPILGTFFIANAIYGLTATPTESWGFPVHIITLCLWIIILLFTTGAFSKIFKWWDKD